MRFNSPERSRQGFNIQGFWNVRLSHIATLASQRPSLLIVACMLLLQLPLVWMGQGADQDSVRVIRSAVTMIDEHRYTASRSPGYPVHEIGTAVLYSAGGVILANLGTVAMSVLCILSFLKIATHYQIPNRHMLALLIIVNPIYWVNSTSTIDYVWALGFSLCGFYLILKRHFVLGGILFGLAIGARLSSGAILVPLLLAEVWFERKNWRVVRGCMLSSVLVALVGMLCYLPLFVASNNTLGFLGYYMGDFGVLGHVARFVYKNIYLWGLPLSIGLVAVLIFSVKDFRSSIRDSLTGRIIVISLGIVLAVEVTFLRFPLEMEYLLPILPFVALLIGHTTRKYPRIVVALIVLQLSYSVVNINLAIPDVPNYATHADIGLFAQTGYVLEDIQLRLADDFR